MIQVHYCYVILPEAEAAYDAITGEPKESYIKVSFDLFKEVPIEKYKLQHEEEFLKLFAKQLGINSSLIKPISYEEYIKHSNGENLF